MQMASHMNASVATVANAGMAGAAPPMAPADLHAGHHVSSSSSSSAAAAGASVAQQVGFAAPGSDVGAGAANPAGASPASPGARAGAVNIMAKPAGQNGGLLAREKGTRLDAGLAAGATTAGAAGDVASSKDKAGRDYSKHSKRSDLNSMNMSFKERALLTEVVVEHRNKKGEGKSFHGLDWNAVAEQHNKSGFAQRSGIDCKKMWNGRLRQVHTRKVGKCNTWRRKDLDEIQMSVEERDALFLVIDRHRNRRYKYQFMHMVRDKQQSLLCVLLLLRYCCNGLLSHICAPRPSRTFLRTDLRSTA